MKATQPERTPKARRRAPRRKTVSYATNTKMRAAFLAGMAKSGREIANDIGVADAQKVRAMLRAHGITLMRDAGTMELIMVRVPRPVALAVTKLADKADMLPEDFAARAITKMVVEEPVILMNLLSDEAPE